jgi:hypothetical protein
MKKLWKRGAPAKGAVILLTLLVSLSVTGASNAGVVTDNFDADPGWTGTGNQSNGNNYGFSASTSFAGGALGEIGGTFSRTNPHRYFDSTLGGTFGTLSLDQALSITGRVIVRNPINYNNNIIFGFFDSADPDNTALGFQISEASNQSTADHRLFLRSESTHGNSVVIDGYDIARTFALTYDPTGPGSLTIELQGPGGASLTEQLNTSFRGSGALLDSIGFVDGGLGNNPANQVDIFVDDLAYTSPLPSGGVVPELDATSGTISLSLLAGLVTLMGERRRGA